jgi:hypothetical protein
MSVAWCSLVCYLGRSLLAQAGGLAVVHVKLGSEVVINATAFPPPPDGHVQRVRGGLGGLRPFEPTSNCRLLFRAAVDRPGRQRCRRRIRSRRACEGMPMAPACTPHGSPQPHTRCPPYTASCNVRGRHDMHPAGRALLGLKHASATPALGLPLPRLHWDWDHPCATSVPGLGSPLPHPHRD